MFEYSKIFGTYLRDQAEEDPNIGLDGKYDALDIYGDSFKKIFDTAEAKKDFGLDIAFDDSFTAFIRPEVATYKGNVTIELVDTSSALKNILTLNQQLVAFEKVVAGVKDNANVGKAFRDATKVCNWVRDVVALETKVAAAYVQAAGKKADESAK